MSCIQLLREEGQELSVETNSQRYVSLSIPSLGGEWRFDQSLGGYGNGDTS